MAHVPVFPVLPDVDWPVAAPFWHAASVGELRFPRCDCCRAFQWYPVPVCPHCRARTWTWVPVGPEGEIYSFTVLRRAFLSGARVPTPVLQVRFPEAPGVTLVTTLADTDEMSRLAVGQRIRMEFVPAAGVSMPVARMFQESRQLQAP